LNSQLQSPLSPPEQRLNLYDLRPQELEPLLRSTVSPPFRIRQIADWLYQRGAQSFHEMTNLSKELRESLTGQFVLSMPEVQNRTAPAPDGSSKYLFKLADGSLIESVYMPMGERTSLCLSSQAGCAVGCTFCVTGFFGAGRNISPAEMVGQARVIMREHAVAPERMNIVFMGMGEPLLNLENVAAALEIFYEQIAPKRITLSTSGIIPGLEELAKFERRPNLAVSINAPDRERREQIMPITKKYPLDELMTVLRRYPAERGREITMEYVLLSGFNDSTADARALAKLVRGIRCKVNAIPFNPDPNLPPWMKRPSDREIDRFVDTLVRSEVPVTVRRSRGSDIAAACGQLRGKTQLRARGRE
jgi:23S rRNA (adenine2503-C2)-methyltransferase